MNVYRVTYTKATYKTISGELQFEEHKERFFTSEKKAQQLIDDLILINEHTRKDSEKEYKYSSFSENISDIEKIEVE